MDRAGLILNRMAEQGHHMTVPRQKIVECVAPRMDTFTAQDILDHLQRLRLPIGRATVFRTLDLLASIGVLHRMHDDEGCHVFAVCAEHSHHHHLRCIVCGTVQVLDAPVVETEIRRLGEAVGFEVVDHVLELLGRCKHCREAARPGVASA